MRKVIEIEVSNIFLELLVLSLNLLSTAFISDEKILEESTSDTSYSFLPTDVTGGDTGSASVLSDYD